MVRREHEKQYQYRKRNLRFFLLEIRRRFPSEKTYRPDWYRGGKAHGLVAVYYVVLRTLLRNKSHLRRYRVRCQHCRIFFLTDPRNEGRTDLGCPFGCAELHRRKESNRRSAEYNRSAWGKRKRKQRQEARRLAESSLGGDGAGSPDGARPDTIPPAAPKGVGSLPARSGDRELDPPSSSPGVSRPAIDPAGGRDTAECEPCSRCGVDRVDPSDRDSSRPQAIPSPIAGSEPAGIEPLGIAAGMLGYLRSVVSLIEGRRVHAGEVLQMLQRMERQHSFARERRIDYVLRNLNEHPP